MKLCIFEDSHYENLLPLVYYRPVYDLRCGIKSLQEKILQCYTGIPYSLHCREYLKDFVEIQNPDININKIDGDTLFINGRILSPSNLDEIIPLVGEDKVYKNGNRVVAARISGKKIEEIKIKLADTFNDSSFDNLALEKIDIPLADYIWDLIYDNGKELINDYNSFIHRNKKAGKSNLNFKVFDGVHLLEKDNIYINDGAVIKPGVVLDASHGPIFIDKNACVNPNSVIEGPFYLGENSLIKSCSMIYENVSIGNTCKVGGEVGDTIFHSFSNKQHSGFMGHGYLGSWVNIGADTNCSDLKNNYSSIKTYVNGKEISTGKQFLGLMMADHSKTAINTMFNTGTTVGFSCNIFGAGFPQKYIPSFSWGGSDSLIVYNVYKSIDTAKKVQRRRQREMTVAEEKLFVKIFELTNNERIERGYSY